MSSQAVAAALPSASGAQSRMMWRTQILAIAGFELRKNFRSKRGIWIYLLALAPVALVWGHSLFELAQGRGTGDHPMATDTAIFSGIFQIFYLRMGIFFGCVGIFTYLFRGEVLERSLHYYFLAPVRREVLLAGKYLAGLITAAIFFTASVTLSFVGIYWHFGQAALQGMLFDGPGLGQLGAYLGVTLLGCMGYGAVFLLAGIIGKNPMLAAGAVFVWEAANLFLPPLLKKISVIFYLKNLCPVPMPTGRNPNPADVLALVVDPTPAHIAIPGLIMFSALVLFLAARRLRRTEIHYGAD